MSANRAWLRALELTASIGTQRERILPRVIEDVAARRGEAPALLSDGECLSYSELQARANQYARWALALGLAQGEVVCLLMRNRPDYLAFWLGLTGVGVVVALLNTNLSGDALAHSIRAVGPRYVVATPDMLEALRPAIASLEAQPEVFLRADPSAGPQGIDLTRYSSEPLEAADRRATTVDDLALYIYTSGTTGLPKAARVSHARLMQWSHWFAGMMEVTPEDRMYNCLPMYHSVGGVQAPGAMLVSGAAVVVREKFSSSAFWGDLARWQCTLFQYIGELCRYLLHTASAAGERDHGIRMACGNGLAPEVWEPFQQRFGIPRILEFYASTEGNVSLFNVPGKVGAVGHIPPYLAHRFSPPLVRHDPDTGEPARGDSGLCIRCGVGETGEALGRLVEDAATLGSRFDGYSSPEATAAKILRDVFEPGDAWFRTGDLMRRDAQNYFYFVDRAGDTFRRKGENVATAEVAASICAFAGVRHANVYGVAVPGVDGRVGMAAVVADADGELDLAGLRAHLAAALPGYARPLFLRLRQEVEVTGTLKYAKAELVREGYDPHAIADPLYVELPGSASFVPLDPGLYDRIQAGDIRF